jgi:hypothetical protein
MSALLKIQKGRSNVIKAEQQLTSKYPAISDFEDITAEKVSY